MAMRVTKTLTPVKGRRYRITRLDKCGVPVYGENGTVVTKGVVTASWSSQTSETDEIRVVNSAGETCVYEPQITNLEGFEGELVFCGLDPDLFQIATGMPVIYDKNGAAVGIAVDVGVSLEDFAFALEIWTGVAGDAACGEVGTASYGYILTPFIKGGRLGDFTIENGAINFTISNATTRKGGTWGKGPYNVVVNTGPGNTEVAGPLLKAVGKTEVMLLQLTNVAPPSETFGGRPLLNPTWTAITTLGKTVTNLSVAFTITPTLVAGQGVYYDFGDGTWDYLTTGNGGTTHVYRDPGTYTVSATTNGKVVTTSVTVTQGS